MPRNNASGWPNYRHNSLGSKRVRSGTCSGSGFLRSQGPAWQVPSRRIVVRMLSMTSTRLATPSARNARYDIDGLMAAIEGIPLVTDPVAVRRRSRDFFWYSPVLNEQLSGKSADLLVVPRDEADVIRVAAACTQRRIPITVRAGGTGNYGQAVPLEGGVLLDVTGLSAVE